MGSSWLLEEEEEEKEEEEDFSWGDFLEIG
jgi:hypothetical protein